MVNKWVVSILYKTCSGQYEKNNYSSSTTTTTQPFNGPISGTTRGEPVPEENFWTFLVQGKINRGRYNIYQYLMYIHKKIT